MLNVMVTGLLCISMLLVASSCNLCLFTVKFYWNIKKKKKKKKKAKLCHTTFNSLYRTAGPPSEKLYQNALQVHSFHIGFSMTNSFSTLLCIRTTGKRNHRAPKRTKLNGLWSKPCFARDILLTWCKSQAKVQIFLKQCLSFDIQSHAPAGQLPFSSVSTHVCKIPEKGVQIHPKSRT